MYAWLMMIVVVFKLLLSPHIYIYMKFCEILYHIGYEYSEKEVLVGLWNKSLQILLN